MSALAGKTALVTGATSGIGLAGARALAGDGAHVVLVGRRQDALDDAVAGIGGQNASAISADVTEPADLARVAATIEAQGGGLDIVFASIGFRCGHRSSMPGRWGSKPSPQAVGGGHDARAHIALHHFQCRSAEVGVDVGDRV